MRITTLIALLSVPLAAVLIGIASDGSCTSTQSTATIFVAYGTNDVINVLSPSAAGRNCYPWELTVTATRRNGRIVVRAQGQNTTGGWVTRFADAEQDRDVPVFRLINRCPGADQIVTQALTPFDLRTSIRDTGDDRVVVKVAGRVLRIRVRDAV